MDEQRNIIETFEELSPRYEEVVDAELNLFWGWRYQSFVTTLLQNTKIHQSDKILDIATGTGVIPTHISLSESDYTSIHGLDITFGMLEHARAKFTKSKIEEEIRLTCASAMDMPYRNQSFSLIFCGLATHHMDVSRLLNEMHRITENGGRIRIADVGGSPLWRLPGIKLFIRVAAFFYFWYAENINRAWAEAMALSNIRTREEWHTSLVQAGFTQISIQKLTSKYRWIPEPLLIFAHKQGEEDDGL